MVKFLIMQSAAIPCYVINTVG